MKTVKTKNGTELPLMDIRGKDYLQVAHRLVWFREEKPNWSIRTAIIEKGVDFCLTKASIVDEADKIIATAHKYEDKKGFPDYIEKSETGAVGRALAMCGYGTQFTDDLDEGERLADAPLPPKPSRMSERVQNMNPQLKEALNKSKVNGAKMLADAEAKASREKFGPPPDPAPWPDDEPPTESPQLKFDCAAGSPAKGATFGPFGRYANKSVTDADDESLIWYRDAYYRSAKDPAKSRFRSGNVEMAKYVELEIEFRKQCGPPQIIDNEEIPF